MSEALLSQSSFGTNDSPKTLKFIKTHNLHATASNIEIRSNKYIYFYEFSSTYGGIFSFRDCIVKWQGASSSYEANYNVGNFGIAETMLDNNRISTIETIPGNYYFGGRYTQSMQISDQTIIMAPAPAMIITIWFNGSGGGSSNNKSAFTFDGYADEYQFT